MPFRLGVIADTHNLLRPEAIDFLKGSEAIIHAGDVCNTAVIQELSALIPVTVVRGNCDHGLFGDSLPIWELKEFAGLQIYVIHDIGTLDLEPSATNMKVVIYGHSHRPEIRERRGVAFMNPGAAGPRRFDLPISVGEILIEDSKYDIRIFELLNAPRPTLLMEKSFPRTKP